MPQFRLTQKFADDCKITQLTEPAEPMHALDDWFIDVMLARRKKIAIITHKQTKLTFFIPYTQAGGAKKIAAYFMLELQNWLSIHHLPEFAKEVVALSEQPFIFTKTMNRKVIGHMNSFKQCAAFFPCETMADWIKIGQKINHMPIKNDKKEYVFSQEVFNQLLGIN